MVPLAVTFDGESQASQPYSNHEAEEIRKNCEIRMLSSATNPLLNLLLSLS